MTMMMTMMAIIIVYYANVLCLLQMASINFLCLQTWMSLAFMCILCKLSFVQLLVFDSNDYFCLKGTVCVISKLWPNMKKQLTLKEGPEW